jgi:predicted nucleotidyltransferase
MSALKQTNPEPAFRPVGPDGGPRASSLRPDFRPDSDVDVLVEFEQGQVPGFLALYEIETELSKLLDDRKVELITERSLNHRLRDRVLASAELEYAEE